MRSRAVSACRRTVCSSRIRCSCLRMAKLSWLNHSRCSSLISRHCQGSNVPRKFLLLPVESFPSNVFSDGLTICSPSNVFSDGLTICSPQYSLVDRRQNAKSTDSPSLQTRYPRSIRAGICAEKHAAHYLGRPHPARVRVETILRLLVISEKRINFRPGHTRRDCASHKALRLLFFVVLSTTFILPH